ncbi:MAG TPA: iron-containing redox enzyme family protein [Polyangia bacterium]
MLTEDLQVRRHPLPATAHPPWMAAMIATLEGPWQRAAWPRLFAETAAGALPPLGAWRIEGRHAEWYLDWLDAVGVSSEEAVAHVPCDEVRALHDHLWQVCDCGSLAEGIAATNWAIEGVTGIWSRGVAETFRGYADDGVRVDARSMMWLNAHARYDDAHPDEALEALKLYIDGEGGRRGNPLGVQWSARRALELFAAAVERGYDLGSG